MVKAPENGFVQVRNLRKHFPLHRGWLSTLFSRAKDLSLRAVDGVDLTIGREETLGIAGEHYPEFDPQASALGRV